MLPGRPPWSHRLDVVSVAVVSVAVVVVGAGFCDRLARGFQCLARRRICIAWRRVSVDGSPVRGGFD